MRNLSLLFVLFLTMGLGACTSPTPYVKAVNGDGYRDTAIEADRYRVSFSGNLVTPRETVENYLLYRAAEVTLESGHDYFILVERQTDKKTQYQTHANCRRVYRRYYGHRRYYRVGPCNAVTRPHNSFKATAVILVRRGRTPDEADAYDARQVLERLGPSAIRPKKN